MADSEKLKEVKEDTKKVNKVLRHPDKDEIIERLSSGKSTREVETWLKKKYAGKSKYHISYMSLQSFRKEYLSLMNEDIEAIKAKEDDRKAEERRTKLKEKIMTSTAYQDKLSEIVSKDLDVNRKMLEMEKLISARMEYYFNALSENPNTREDRVFIELLAAQREVLRDWKKYVEGVADKTVEHNINISVVNEQVSVLKRIVYEVLLEVDPSLIPIFVDKLNSRMEMIEYNSSDYANYKKIGVIDGG